MGKSNKWRITSSNELISIKRTPHEQMRFDRKVKNVYDHLTFEGEKRYLKENEGKRKHEKMLRIKNSEMVA